MADPGDLRRFGGESPPPTTTWSSLRLLRRARSGEPAAVTALFERHFEPLVRWAHGRLPRFARAVADTVDIVQDAVARTFRRLDVIEPAAPRALQAYLRRAVQNRIHDEIRRASRHPETPLGDRSEEHTSELQSPTN